MMPFRVILPLLALLALPACILPVPVPEGTPGAFEVVLDSGDPCGAGKLQRLVGEPRFAIEDTTFTAPVRLIGPGDAVTMDFSPSRLNLEFGEDDRVARVFCG